jgi:NADPH2:quinone reductase
MKVIRYHEKGPPDVLNLEEVPLPEPGEGEVLVRILATGVSFADVLRRSGAYYPVPVVLPHIPGAQMAGQVEKLGPNTDASLQGKLVFGSVSTGAYAEYGIAKAEALRAIPAGIDPADAVAILSESETASMALKLAGRLQPGETVYVPAATGGVGYLAVQLAQLYGAGRVFGAGSSEAKRAIIAGFGATPIDYTKAGWPQDLIAQNGGAGVDLALEVNGGQAVYDTLDALRPGGRMVNYGIVSDTDAPVNPRALLRRNLTLTGFFRGASIRDGLWPEERKQLNLEVEEFMVAGKLKPLIGKTFSLAEAADAHRALENRESAGKVMLLPQA